MAGMPFGLTQPALSASPLPVVVDGAAHLDVGEVLGEITHHPAVHAEALHVEADLVSELEE